MTGRPRPLGASAALLALLAAAGCRGTPNRGGEPPAAGSGTAAPIEPAAPSGGVGDFRDVPVLFPSPNDDFLHAVTRRILWTASVEDRARQVLSELLSGPDEGLLAAMPAGVRLREFYLLPDGTAFADFSGEIRSVRGTAGERIGLQSVVLSLRMNFPEIRRVGILVDGEEVETLAGHVDLRYPLRPDPSLLAPGSPPLDGAGAPGSPAEPQAGAAPGNETDARESGEKPDDTAVTGPVAQ